jgi:hypothetical protein
MSFEQISYLAQIVASVGVIVSLIFVGLQIKHNTGALQRNEHNSTMAQWTVIRMAIAGSRDIATDPGYSAGLTSMAQFDSLAPASSPFGPDIISHY